MHVQDTVINFFANTFYNDLALTTFQKQGKCTEDELIALYLAACRHTQITYIRGIEVVMAAMAKNFNNVTGEQMTAERFETQLAKYLLPRNMDEGSKRNERRQIVVQAFKQLLADACKHVAGDAHFIMDMEQRGRKNEMLGRYHAFKIVLSAALKGYRQMLGAQLNDVKESPVVTMSETHVDKLRDLLRRALLENEELKYENEKLKKMLTVRQAPPPAERPLSTIELIRRSEEIMNSRHEERPRFEELPEDEKANAFSIGQETLDRDSGDAFGSYADINSLLDDKSTSPW
jgi:hypothetical protein